MLFRALIVAVAMLWLAGCSDAPSVHDLSKAVERHIIWQPWQVDSIDVQHESAVGDGYQYNFIATLSPKTDLYAVLFTLGDSRVVRPVQDGGDDVRVKGVADVSYGSHGWEFVISFESDPFAEGGQPRQEGDISVDAPGYRERLAQAAAEAQQLEADVQRLNSKVAALRQEHGELTSKILKTREDNRLRLQKWEDDFEKRKDQVEDALRVKIGAEQNKINDQQKQQLIELSAKFEKKFTNTEKQFSDQRQALDQALTDNDRDYNRAVHEIHESFKRDVGSINADGLSADEYRSYNDSRRNARDATLLKLQEEHQTTRDQLRREKDQVLSRYDESMALLKDEKTATLEEARRIISAQKEKVIRQYQQQQEEAMAKLEAEFAVTREDLLKDEKATVSRQHEVARELEKVAAEQVAKQTRLESILRGLAVARELDVPDSSD